MAIANEGETHISRAILRWWQYIPEPVRYVWIVTVYLIIWAVLDKIALAFETAPEISVWSPASALDFVLLLVFGLRYSPALLLNTLVHNYLVTGRNLDFVTLLIFNLITTLGHAGASALLLKLRINPRLRTLRDIVWLVTIASLAAPAVVGLLKAVNFASNGIIPWPNFLIYALHYWAGDATGIAMLAPILLVLLRRVPEIWAHREQEPAVEASPLLPRGKKAFESLGELVVLGIGIWLGYGAPKAANLDYTYFVFLPLIWIAVRHGLERATVAIFLINVSVVVLVGATYGQSNNLALQFGMMAISQTGLLLGAISTDRMQAEKALRYSAKRLKILYELDREILAARSLLEIAQAALHWIQQLVPCQEISIVMFDFEAREFMVLAVQMNNERLQPGVRLPLARFGDISALHRGEVNMIQDTLIFSDLPPVAQMIVGEGIRAYMNVPLIAQGELIGSLNLGKEQLGAFKPKQIDVAREVANLVAIAIQQARLFSRVEQQVTRERSLNQITKTLNSSLDPNQVLQEIAQLTGEYFSVDRVIIFAIANQRIQVLNEWRGSDQVISVLDLEIPLPEFSNTSDFHYREVFYTPDVTQIQMTTRTQSRVQQAQLLSVLSVPILIRDQLFGRLSLQTTSTKRIFTEDEIYLLERIADQAAIALYNAQSYERLEEAVKQRTQELEHEKLLSEAANRAKSDFMSNMSHELRTPLTSILGFSSILIEEIFGSLNAKQEQYIELISTSGKHLLELINDLLDLSKIEVGREELFLENIVVEELANACILMVQERANNHGLQLSLDIADHVITCVGDKRRLKQILVNLLSNAVKFTDSGSVTLKINQTIDEIQFSVIDTGIGIAPADQATLFQPFHQLDSGLNRKYEGTGLGLALSRKLAQLHGGDITLQSEVGCGSCFTLHLPKQEVESGESQ